MRYRFHLAVIFMISLQSIPAPGQTATDREVGTWKNEFMDQDGISRYIMIELQDTGLVQFEHNFFGDLVYLRGEYTYDEAQLWLDIDFTEYRLAGSGWQPTDEIPIGDHTVTRAKFGEQEAVIGYQLAARPLGRNDISVFLPDQEQRQDTLSQDWYSQANVVSLGDSVSFRVSLAINQDGSYASILQIDDETLSGSGTWVWEPGADAGTLFAPDGSRDSTVSQKLGLMAVAKHNGNRVPVFHRVEQLDEE